MAKSSKLMNKVTNSKVYLWCIPSGKQKSLAVHSCNPAVEIIKQVKLTPKQNPKYVTARASYNTVHSKNSNKSIFLFSFSSRKNKIAERKSIRIVTILEKKYSSISEWGKSKACQCNNVGITKLVNVIILE